MGKGMRGWGKGDRGITKLKTNVIPGATEKKKEAMSFAHLAACSRGWVQHCGMNLLQNGFLFVCVLA